MLGKNETEIVRILRDVVSAVASLSPIPPLFSGINRKAEADLMQARRLGRYSGLIQKLINDINSGIPLEDIWIKK